MGPTPTLCSLWSDCRQSGAEQLSNCGSVKHLMHNSTPAATHITTTTTTTTTIGRSVRSTTASVIIFPTTTIPIIPNR